MGIFDGLEAALDKLERWRKLQDRVDTLERELAELKARFFLPQCPFCGAPAWRLAKSTPNPDMEEMGVHDRIYRCDSCGKSETRVEV